MIFNKKTDNSTLQTQLVATQEIATKADDNVTSISLSIASLEGRLRNTRDEVEAIRGRQVARVQRLAQLQSVEATHRQGHAEAKSYLDVAKGTSGAELAQNDVNVKLQLIHAATQEIAQAQQQHDASAKQELNQVTALQNEASRLEEQLSLQRAQLAQALQVQGRSKEELARYMADLALERIADLKERISGSRAMLIELDKELEQAVLEARSSLTQWPEHLTKIVAPDAVASVLRAQQNYLDTLIVKGTGLPLEITRSHSKWSIRLIPYLLISELDLEYARIRNFGPLQKRRAEIAELLLERESR